MNKLNENYTRTIELLTKKERPTLLNLSYKHVDRLLNLISENFKYRGEAPTLADIKNLMKHNGFILSKAEYAYIYNKVDKSWFGWQKPQTHTMIGQKPYEFLHSDGSIHCAVVEAFKVEETGEIYQMTDYSKTKNKAWGVYKNGI